MSPLRVAWGVLRRLLQRLRPAASPQPAPSAPPAAPDARFVDAAGLAALQEEPLCLDLRPASELRYGIVQGAWLLPDPALLPPTSRSIIVLAADPEPAAALGWPVTWGGLAAWRAAGFAIREPEWKSPLPLLHPVAVDRVPGWIQDVAWTMEGFVYAVLLTDGRRLEGLCEEEISTTARGAAGLGEQL